MPTITTTVECPIQDSFRVAQIAGMFDLSVGKRASQTFSVEVPSRDELWKIGAIVGPSGSGKSTIARAAFGEDLYTPHDWDAEAALVDGLDHGPIKQITQTLTAVGLASPPSWIKPYRVLSTGERFRADLARSMLLDRELIVFDEFTSVVDRTVARIGSAALSKSIRQERIQRRFVAVTCHYDILEWLQPDWTVDMATLKLTRGCLRRPSINLAVAPCARSAWPLFARHHYLSGALSPTAECYLTTWNSSPVAFCAVVALYGFKGRRRIHRVVTLPDYQGLGIGARLTETVANEQRRRGHRVNITTSHPAMIAYCQRSSHWRTVNVSKVGSGMHRKGAKRFISSAGRSVVSFEYIE